MHMVVVGGDSEHTFKPDFVGDSEMNMTVLPLGSNRKVRNKAKS